MNGEEDPDEELNWRQQLTFGFEEMSCLQLGK